MISHDFLCNHSVLLDGKFFLLITENSLSDLHQSGYRIMKDLFSVTFSTSLYAITILPDDDFANTLHQIYVVST